MKALVTGGGGFLGSAVVRQLRAAGHEVTVVARGSYPAIEATGARMARVDLGDLPALVQAAAGHDVVFHVAAKTGVWGKEADFVATNVKGTEHVLEACRKNGIARLVYTSSPSVIFDGHDHVDAGPDLPYPERYEAFYPRTKAEAERMVLAANGIELATVSLRPHLIYGPGDPWLLPRVIARHRAGRLRIVGDGQNRVSLTFVDNAAAAHLQAAAALTDAFAPCAGKAWFVNDPEPVVLWAWVNRMFEAVGLPRLERRVPLWAARAAGGTAEAVWNLFGLAGEPPMTRFVASQLATSHTYRVEPAQAAFGYAPPVSGEEAFARTAAYWKANLPAPG